MTCNVLLYDISNSIEHLQHIHEGRISFTYDKQKMRPFRYEERTGHTYRFLKAKDIIELTSSVSLIAMIPNERPDNLTEYLEFFQYAKASKPKVIPVCLVCLNERKLTKIPAEDNYSSYEKPVCRRCAADQIKTEYLKRGIPISISAKKFYMKQLDRLKEVKLVIESIWEPVKASKQGTSSLFDVISADTKNQPVPIQDYVKKNRNLLDPELVDHLQNIGIKSFMPVQIKAMEGGLMSKEDLLVVAGTSSGKTLVGELAGIQNWKTRNEKFIFVTPLVALTNQKYDSFKKRYGKLGARVAIRVGKSRIVDNEVNNSYTDGSISKADIIVATYEALDWIFRSGKWRQINNIGTLVIDEFQLLADEERGGEVDGLLARIRTLYPRCQIIGLSATIGNEEELAKLLKLKLISYMDRPIPLERHLLISDGEEKKIDILENLVKEESKVVSSTRHRGQTLIFTNTRRRVQEIGNSLKGTGLKSGYYHAGMTYNQRRKVEREFESGKLDVLTTTAALGAGADFPVSQVIFERPAMGARWISIAEYHQMAGRAGRLGYHDLGRAIMIATVGEKIYHAQDKSEEQIAFEILTGEVEDIEGEVDYEHELDQVLAFISAAYPVSDSQLKMYYNELYFRTNQLSNIVKSLSNMGLIVRKSDTWLVSHLGRAISESFLRPSFGYKIAKKTLNQSINEIAVEISPLESVYISRRMLAKLEHALKTHLSSRFFSDGILETITNMTQIKGNLSPMLMDKIRFWQRNFFDCDCKSNPYCVHPIQKVSMLVLDLRMEGRSTSQITNILSREYDLLIYQGDLLTWLDSIIHAINAIGRLAKAMNNEELIKESTQLALNIEAPQINFSLHKGKPSQVITKAKEDTKGDRRKKPPHLQRKKKKSVNKRMKDKK
ncbi:MAG: DEAD/DEAH box helicase [Candidatus Heimdallarchaeota archaeon]|nr:DEAD/DEAH box helicase [Candidatus Heimdallarchaeota archaeon]